MYTLLLFFLPQYYYDLKAKKIDQSVSNVANSSYETPNQVLKKLKKIATQNDVNLFLTDYDNSIALIPNLQFEDSNFKASSPETFSNASVAEVGKVNNYHRQKVFINQQPFFILYNYQIKKINDISQALWKFAGYFIFFALLLSFIASFFFARRTVRPIEQMSRVAKKWQC